MTSRPALNCDVLLEVVAACSWETSAALLDTSRFLHLEGPRVLLRQTVHLDTEKEVILFLAFLRRALDDIRYKSVRDLRLGVSDMKGTTSSELVFALSLMHNLSSLGIYESEYLLHNIPVLLDTIAALTSLQELSLSIGGARSIKLLQSSQSTLATVYIGFPPDYPEHGFFDEGMTPVSDWPQYHPAVVLARFRSTLQELECERWYTHPEITADPGLVYPEMRRLRMRSVSLPLTISLVRAYPELAYLSIYTGEGDDDDTTDKPHYGVQHYKNVVAQTRPGCAWRELEEFFGTLVDLYMTGITCPINQVELRALHRDYRYMLDPVLSYARPRHLFLSDWQGLPESPATAFVAFQGQGGSRLESLRIDIWALEEDTNVDVAELMESLMSSLAHAPLQSLDVDMFMEILDPRPNHSSLARILREFSGSPSPPPVDPQDYPLLLAERSADEFDLADYVRRFARLVPTLRQATIRINGLRCGWRRVKLKDGEVMLEGAAHSPSHM